MIRYRNGNLFCENVNLNDITKTYNTPIYIYSKAMILKNCHDYRNAFDCHNLKNYKIHFAMKANYNLSILKLFLQEGLGIDAVSIGEIQKARFAGFEYKDIVFSGVGKTRDDLLYAIRNGVGQINVESFEEIQHLINIVNTLKQHANVAVRVNPDIKAHTHDKISTGSKNSKFGIDIEDLNNAIQIIQDCHYLNLNGLSIHIGSQLTCCNDFEKAFACIADIYKQHTEFKTVDLGGGLGIKYGNEEIISKYDYVGIIAKYFGDFNGNIIIEPGRSLIGDTCIFLTRIVRIKHNKTTNFLIVDGGMNNLIRPAMYSAWHQPILTKNFLNNEKNDVKYDIVGPICESSDIFCKNVPLSRFAREDDCIAFLNAGAYGRSMSSLYNLNDIAGELMIDDEMVYSISKAICWKDLIQFEDGVINI